MVSYAMRNETTTFRDILSHLASFTQSEGKESRVIHFIKKDTNWSSSSSKDRGYEQNIILFDKFNHEDEDPVFTPAFKETYVVTLKINNCGKMKPEFYFD